MHYIIPVQAKTGRDKLGSTQIEQDIDLCTEKFPAAVCRSIGAQFTQDRLIALFEFTLESGKVRIASEKHYRLVTRDELSPSELAEYQKRAE